MGQEDPGPVRGFHVHLPPGGTEPTDALGTLLQNPWRPSEQTAATEVPEINPVPEPGQTVFGSRVSMYGGWVSGTTWFHLVQRPGPQDTHGLTCLYNNATDKYGQTTMVKLQTVSEETPGLKDVHVDQMSTSSWTLTVLHVKTD